MSSAHVTSDQPEKPTLTLIQQIKDGTIHPSALSKEQRQQCVVVLWSEGYPYPQTAQLLDISEKTVQRAIGDFRAKNAVAPNLELAKQVVGELFVKFANHHGRLTRLARSGEGSVGERTHAEYLAWKTVKEFIETLQSLGYLPQQPQQVIGDLVYHIEEPDGRSYDDMKSQLADIESAAQQAGQLNPELVVELQQIRQRIQKEELALQVNQLTQRRQEDHVGEEHDG